MTNKKDIIRLPDRDEIGTELIKLLWKYKIDTEGSVYLQDIYLVLAKKFNLSKEDLNKVCPNGSIWWESRISGILSELKAKKITNNNNAYWELTSSAVQKLESLIPRYILSNYDINEKIDVTATSTSGY